MSRVLELFGRSTQSAPEGGWSEAVKRQWCPYLGSKCIKVRKSQPDICIGTCTVCYGASNDDLVICPHRLLQRSQVFTDCLHLLTLHEPGNELHVVRELSLPGGSVDHCLASARGGKVVDFVGVELQTLDTTGTVWPERQRFLQSHGLPVDATDAESAKGFGMNWKMNAKTILVQLHHKIGSFSHVGKHLVLVTQDRLLAYMTSQFSFEHVKGPYVGDPMHFHAYALARDGESFRLELTERRSTDEDGVSKCLGLMASCNVELHDILAQLEAKITPNTLVRLGP